MRKVELVIEAIIFQSRWLLAPFYLGLAFCLLLLLYHFGMQVYEFVLRIPHASETDVILGLLSLIDVVYAFAAATAVALHAELWTGDPELLIADAPWRWRDLR